MDPPSTVHDTFTYASRVQTRIAYPIKLDVGVGSPKTLHKNTPNQCHGFLTKDAIRKSRALNFDLSFDRFCF